MYFLCWIGAFKKDTNILFVYFFLNTGLERGIWVDITIL